MRCYRVVVPTLIALLCTGTLLAAPTVPLESGQPRTFNLAGSSLVNSFYVDVPASSQRLTLDLIGNAGAGDIDLLLNSVAPFPDTVNGNPPTVQQIFDFAQYRSASIESNEKLVIGRANVFPVRAGRWYISVLNFSSTPATPTITATLSDQPPGALPIEIAFGDTTDGCEVAEWNNPAARAPVSGNGGSTLGQQRRNAVIEAVRLIGNTLKSDLPVRVQACWSNLGTGSTVTLAQAGPRSLLAGEGWMPRTNTFYAVAPATKLGGARSCGLRGGDCDTTYDIRATFNDRIDTNEVPFDYYYGFTGSGAFGSVDFIAIAMHELVHGLGFISGVNTRAEEGPIGEKLDGLDDAYSHNLVVVNPDDTTFRRFMDITDAERAAAIIGINRLRWDDLRAVNSSFNVAAGFGAPLSYIFMHSPDPIRPGSSLSHVGTRHTGDLMLAQASVGQRDLRLGGPMLEAVGWGTSAVDPPPPVLPASNNLFDVKRDGHGIDFVRASGSVYVLTFYTYGATGEPEWFQAVGNVVNGVFVANTDTNGKSLLRYRYNAANTPPQQAVSADSGTVSLDFNNPAAQAPCNDGRNAANAVAVMTFSLGSDQNVRWCMEPVIAASARADADRSGLWFGGGMDDGWGWSLINFRLNNQDGMFGLFFYYDANGNGSFAFAQTSAYVNGTQYPAIHRRGYCRSCPTVPFNDQPAGTVAFTLPATTGAGTVTYDVTPQNSVGGRFARTNSPFILLTAPQ